MPLIFDLAGKKFGEWTVIRRADNLKRATMWECVCSCGVVRDVAAHSLRRGNSLCCGFHVRDRCWIVGLDHTIHVYKLSAKNSGKEWDLLDFQVAALISQKCFYCGIEPLQRLRTKRTVGEKIVRVELPEFRWNGIDRMDNSEGYTWDNCVPCYGTCNFMKQDMSHQEFIDKCSAIATNRGLLCP